MANSNIAVTKKVNLFDRNKPSPGSCFLWKANKCDVFIVSKKVIYINKFDCELLKRLNFLVSISLSVRVIHFH